MDDHSKKVVEKFLIGEVSRTDGIITAETNKIKVVIDHDDNSSVLEGMQALTDAVLNGTISRGQYNYLVGRINAFCGNYQQSKTKEPKTDEST